MALDEPVETILQLFDARDKEFPLGWGLGRPEIRRTVGQVDMVIS
jgi:hypothetical protein